MTLNDRQLGPGLGIRLSTSCGSGLQVLSHANYYPGQSQDKGEKTDHDLESEGWTRYDWCGPGRCYGVVHGWRAECMQGGRRYLSTEGDKRDRFGDGLEFGRNKV
jgi:hypothetical protein